ncbi:MAG: 1-deoxy-D-xylulose-5-phosphate synthase [Deltaproteobacteria bacterium]|nr:1-deoxy-D-xylulose-5-phosphate synthase [Deltaproteobacteria bacterium]
MGSLLEKVNSPADIKGLSVEELNALASEIRAFMVGGVSKTGGHLASSLGAVELTLAMHYVFNAPKDKIIWDVGHQSYAHKIITGRKDNFSTLRKKGGICGFSKPSESPYDTVITGHSSTSISSGLGMATARDLAGGDYAVISIIGDGSLTAGVAFEGLNQAGHLKKNMIVVLNDNEMSISKNVGALSTFLSRKITGRFATNAKKEIERIAKSIPAIGDKLLSVAKKAEESLITFFTPGMLFEGLGFHYVGPLDGHDTAALIEAFNDLKEVNGPILMHVMTTKGKGYGPAEKDPLKFHGIGAFDVATGSTKPSFALTYTDAFSAALTEIAERDPRVVAITAAMPEGTGLSKFAERFPERFIDVGIAEQHALTFAAGLAKEGYRPVAAIYSTFLQRAYDQVVHDICIENIPVIIAMDRAGIVGADGPTHHGLFDVSYLRHIPNMIVAAPKDEAELRNMLWSATRYKSPVAIRYPRGACKGKSLVGPFVEIVPGSAEVVREGSDITIAALGTMVTPALEAAERLATIGIKAEVINARFAKPLDKETIIRSVASTGLLVTVEENALAGGFGSAVLELLSDENVKIRVKRLGAADVFIEHGTQEELRKEAGLDTEAIEAAVKALIDERKRQRITA